MQELVGTGESSDVRRLEPVRLRKMERMALQDRLEPVLVRKMVGGAPGGVGGSGSVMY